MMKTLFTYGLIVISFWAPYFVAAQEPDSLAAATDLVIISSPVSNYIIVGDLFETDITLCTNRLKLDDYYVQVIVSGASVPFENNKATYQSKPFKAGTTDYHVEIKLRHKVNAEVISVERDFTFEVMGHSVHISPDKMNIFYIGVDNPISIAAAGPSKDIAIFSENIDTVIVDAPGRYTVRVSKPGQAKLEIRGKGVSTVFSFRNKRIPDPKAVLKTKKDGTEYVSASEFRTEDGVRALLEHFDFDAYCTIATYEVVRIDANGKRNTVINQGGRFSDESQKLINEARKGDIYLFREITCTCPGDAVNRKLESILIEIK